jgi:hypothetical protein
MNVKFASIKHQTSTWEEMLERSGDGVLKPEHWAIRALNLFGH